MAGSTLLTTQNPGLLLEIGSFDCLELDRMVTLDLEILANLGGVKWAKSQPIVYGPDDGLAIFKIARSGLTYLLRYPIGKHTEHREDLSKILEFVQMYGIDYIYEMATF